MRNGELPKAATRKLQIEDTFLGFIHGRGCFLVPLRTLPICDSEG